MEKIGKNKNYLSLGLTEFQKIFREKLLDTETKIHSYKEINIQLMNETNEQRQEIKNWNLKILV